MDQKGSLPLRGCAVLKTDHKDQKFSFTLTHPVRKPLVLAASDEKTMDDWIAAINAEILLADKPTLTPESCMEVLGLERTMEPKASEVSRAYRKLCLKVHPDKGGTQEEFKRVQDAHAFLMNEIEAADKAALYNSVVFKVTIEKGGKGVGFGMMVTEDPATKKIIVKDVMPTMMIRSSENPAFIPKKGDQLIKIGKDQCAKWPLSRIICRLNDFRVPVNQSVAFVFLRLIRKDGLTEEEVSRADGFHDTEDTTRENEQSTNFEGIGTFKNTTSRTPVFNRHNATSSPIGGRYESQARKQSASPFSSPSATSATSAKAELEDCYEQLNQSRLREEEMLARLEIVAQQNSQLHVALAEAQHKEEFALLQLHQMMSMTEVTSDQKQKVMQEVEALAVAIKNDKVVTASTDVEEYLAHIGLNKFDIGVKTDDSISTLRRRAIIAASVLDGSGGILQRWELSGDSALQKLIRLEDRLKILSGDEGVTSNTTSISSPPQQQKGKPISMPKKSSLTTFNSTFNSRSPSKSGVTSPRNRPGGSSGTKRTTMQH